MLIQNINTRFGNLFIWQCIFMYMGWPGDSVIKHLPVNAEDLGSIPGQEDPLEKEMATHSRIPAWEIPWTEEPGRLHRVAKSRTWLNS